MVGDERPYALMLALFVLTAALGQVVSNTATVLIVVPIAMSAAAETGISPQSVLMLVAVAGAASLLTPIATPANMMVMGPAGLPVRRLLEVRPGHHGGLARRRGGAGAGHLADGLSDLIKCSTVRYPQHAQVRAARMDLLRDGTSQRVRA